MRSPWRRETFSTKAKRRCHLYTCMYFYSVLRTWALCVSMFLFFHFSPPRLATVAPRRPTSTIHKIRGAE
jgi:hypothetical protein